MVELRGDGGNHHEKQGLNRISCASQCTIPNSTGTTPDLVHNNTDTMSCIPNQASRTPDFAYPLVSSMMFSSSSPISHFLVHNSTIIAEHNVMSSLSISPCHDHDLTQSAAYTQCGIHRIQHTPSTAYTYYCLSSLHSHDYELTPECSFSIWCASLQINHHQTAFHKSFKGKVTLSHSHGSKLTNRSIVSAPGMPPIDHLQIDHL